VLIEEVVSFASQALLRPAVRGDSNSLRVGQQVLAIGGADFHLLATS